MHEVQDYQADLNTREESRFEMFIISVEVGSAVLDGITFPLFGHSQRQAKRVWVGTQIDKSLIQLVILTAQPGIDRFDGALNVAVTELIANLIPGLATHIASQPLIPSERILSDVKAIATKF